MAFFQDMPDNPLLLTGLLAGLLASLACGLVGPYVVTRRIVFLSGAIAHTAIGGLGAAVFLRAWFPETFAGLEPIHGAVAAALLSAVLIGLVHGRVAERMDTLIGAMWALGMAVGLMLIKFTPGYQNQLMTYLFGNLAAVDPQLVRLLAWLGGVIVLAVLLFHKRLVAVCLDEQQAELQGISVLGTNLVLLCLVALTVICLTQVIGLILVIALLSLPAAAVGHHVKRLPTMMWLSTLLCMVLTTLPRIGAYELEVRLGVKLSPESAIVLAAAGVYLVSVPVKLARQARAV